MMIQCEKCVDSICDFCAHYDFNGLNGSKSVYNDKGWCNKFNIQNDPEAGQNCDEFVCFQTKEGKNIQKERGAE